jgi:hypothetical protein
VPEGSIERTFGPFKLSFLNLSTLVEQEPLILLRSVLQLISESFYEYV